MTMHTESRLNGEAVHAPPKEETEFEKLLNRPVMVTPMERFISKKADFWTIANAIHKSGLASHLRSAEAVFAVMLYGYRFGWDVWTSIQNCHIINGRVSQSAASMLAIAVEAGAKYKIKESGRGGASGTVGEWCEFTISRPEFDPVTKTWTQADARRAGLVKQDGNHQKYPGAMLQWRAVADACRFLFPDKLAGVRATEEIAEQIAGVDGADPNWVDRQPRGKQKEENPFAGNTPDAPMPEGEAPADQPGAALPTPPSPGGGEPAATHSPAAPVPGPSGRPKSNGKKTGADAQDRGVQPVAGSRSGGGPEPSKPSAPVSDGDSHSLADDPTIKADEFSNTPLPNLRKYLLNDIRPEAKEAAMRMAGVSNLVDCTEPELRAVAFNAKLAELNGEMK